MQVELKIKEILGETGSVETKVKIIREFMNWNEDKLTEVIIKHGTHSSKQRGCIINEFWGGVKPRPNREARRADLSGRTSSWPIGKTNNG